MANRTAANYETDFLDALQINTTTDPPISTVASAGSFAAAKTSALLNKAGVQIFEEWKGTITKAASATLWATAQSADTTGTVAGILTTVSEVLHLWSTATSGSTGGVAGENELDKVDIAQILQLRNTYGASPPYTTPVVYCVTPLATSTAADVGKLRLDYWPGVSGLYFPAWYIAHWVDLAATTDVADLPDLAQRDLPILAAYYAAPLIDRTDLQPVLAAELSDKTRLMLVRRLSAKQDARADDSER